MSGLIPSDAKEWGLLILGAIAGYWIVGHSRTSSGSGMSKHVPAS
jgi:hypothetical protein